MSSISRAYILVLIATILVIAASVQAQNIQNPQSAVDNTMRSNLHVDESTGAMQLQIPLGMYRGRGEASLPITLSYSSKLWNIKYQSTLTCGSPEGNEPVSAYRAEYAKGSASGWTSSLGWFLPTEDVPWEVYDSATQKPSHQHAVWQVARMYVRLPDGSRHELRLDDSLRAFPANVSGLYRAVDGSRLSYDSTQDILLMPDGSRYRNFNQINGAIQYVDRNGNALTYSSGSWTDTLGRSIGVPIPGTAPPAGAYPYDLPGVNGTMRYWLRWRNLGDALTDTSQSLHYPGDSPTDSCTPGGFQGNNLFRSMDDQQKVLQGILFNPRVLYQIELPNGTSYTFTYNVYGELNKIVYPTGGSETFGYDVLEPLGGQLDDGTYSQANRGVFSRIVSDGTTTQTWQYNNGSNSDAGVDTATAARWVTAANGSITKTWYYKSRGDQIKYGFDDARTGMAREERVYSSNGTTTTMLRRTVYQLVEDYALSGGYQTATRNARVVKKIDIILDTGGDALASATEMDYDSDLNVIRTRHYDYVSISQTTAQSADYSSIPNGTLLRTDETDYLTGDANYRARNLLSLPTATRIRNGAGTIMAQSSIAYDEYSLTPVGTISTWIDPGGYRGETAPSSGSCEVDRDHKRGFARIYIGNEKSVMAIRINIALRVVITILVFIE